MTRTSFLLRFVGLVGLIGLGLATPSGCGGSGDAHDDGGGQDGLADDDAGDGPGKLTACTSVPVAPGASGAGFVPALPDGTSQMGTVSTVAIASIDVALDGGAAVTLRTPRALPGGISVGQRVTAEQKSGWSVVRGLGAIVAIRSERGTTLAGDPGTAGLADGPSLSYGGACRYTSNADPTCAASITRRLAKARALTVSLGGDVIVLAPTETGTVKGWQVTNIAVIEEAAYAGLTAAGEVCSIDAFAVSVVTAFLGMSAADGGAD